MLLKWRLAQGYGGGAAPSQRVLDEQDKRADGAVRVDLRSRSVQPVTPEGARSALGESTTTLHPASLDVAADVVDASRVGRLRWELATSAAAGSVVLRCVDEEAGVVAWEIVLDDSVDRPPRLRP